jgi:hypothetical protein
MSNQGIRGFYQITQNIKTQLLNDININTVTTGEITDIDLSKQTIFPLAHIIVNDVQLQEQVLTFNITILSMDILNVYKEKETDIFLGNDNEQDILNTQLSVLNKLVMILRKGTLYLNKYQLVGDPSCEPFFERFENQLAGWSCTMDIQVQNDIDIC